MEEEFDLRLCLGIVRLSKVGGVFLSEPLPTAHGVSCIVLVDTTSGEVGDVNLVQIAQIDQIQRSDNIRADGGLLVILAPIDSAVERSSSNLI